MLGESLHGLAEHRLPFLGSGPPDIAQVDIMVLADSLTSSRGNEIVQAFEVLGSPSPSTIRNCIVGTSTRTASFAEG